MNRRLQRVNVASLRVAVMATGILVVAYAVVAAIVVVVVTNTLTGQVDSRLTTALSEVQNNQPVTMPRTAPGDGRPFATQLYFWEIAPDGSTRNTAGVDLPAGLVGVTSPTTTTIGGHEVRLDGIAIDGGHFVVGQTLDSVEQTRSTLVTTELFVGITLIVVVFLGALFGGRRVGAPIELARQRQLEFTADASHELRTPLSVIEAQTSLALAQDRDPDWYRAAFQRVGSESGRIRRLVEDLLWLARVDVTAGAPSAEPVDLGVLTQQAVDRFAAVAEAGGVALTLAIGSGAHAVMGSPEWLDRLLGVLLDNACKYSPRQGRVAVSVEGDGGRIRLRVDDSGPGIPPEERSRIFERFHRATHQGSGSGLGLAIADAVVRRTNGRWEIGRSELGGASMAVSWPRALGGARGEAVLAPAPPQRAVRAPSSAAVPE